MQVGEYYIDPVSGDVKPVVGGNSEAAFRNADDEALRRAAANRAATPGEAIWRDHEDRVTGRRQVPPPPTRVGAAAPSRRGRGGLVGAAVGGALGGALGDDPQAEAALGAAAGYGVERGLRALPLDKITPKGYGIEKLGAKIIPGLGVIAQGGQEIYKGIRGEYTPTEQYAQELGLNTPSSLMGDVAVRSLGIGNDILMGVPGYAMRGLRRLQGVEEAPANQAAPTAVPATGTSALDPAIFRLDASSGDALSESIRRGALGDNLFNALEGAREPVRLPADAASQIQPAPQRQGALQQPGQQVTPVQQPEQQDFAIQPNEQTVRAATDTFGLQELQDENEAINRLADAYQQRTGQAIPQELSAMDKFQVLAKGLGIGLLVAAFPGFGLAAGLGLGLAAGGDELGKRRGALAAGAQQGFENDQTTLANVMEMAKARRQNLLDQISVRTGAEERAERSRQFDRTALQGDRKIGLDERELGLKQQELSIRAQQLATQGYQQTVDGATGEVVFVHPTREPVRTGVTAPPQQGFGRGALGVSYNPLEDIRGIADQLDPSLPYEQRMDMAAEQAARYAQGFNAGVPGFPGARPQNQQGYVEGQVYTDANGNQAIYQNGQFIEVQ